MSKVMTDMSSSRSNRARPAVRTGLDNSVVWLALFCLFLPVLAAFSPINHDETQYIASAQLVSDGLVPFRDFLYLQTPYQIYLFAPLFGVFEEYGFLASRIATGLIGAATLAFAYGALRMCKVEPSRAAICALLLALCHTFVFSVTVVRNDAVPAVLLAAAICVAAFLLSDRGLRPERLVSWGLAGVLLGFAAGTKVSYLAPALCFAGFPIWAALLKATPWRAALLRSIAVSLGLALTLAPLLWLRDMAPLAFDYGNFGYHAEAPLAWYSANGLEDRLTVIAKVRDVLLTLVRGPALFALIIYGWVRAGSLMKREGQRPILLLLDVLIFAGLVATIAPTPTWRQYAMPLLPPLFVGIGLVWQDHAKAGAPLPKLARYAFVLAAVAGIGQPVFQLWKGAFTGASTPLVIQAEGRLLARETANARLTGPVASLSPEVVLASGLSLDPTFATGPFAYRTGDMIEARDRRVMRITSHGSVAEYLAQTQPDAIVTGYENFDYVDALGLEVPIEEYANAAGYTRVESPYGDAVIWLRVGEEEGR